MRNLTELYDAYVDTFRGVDGKLPPMMELKRVHTAHVVANARAIASGEGFDGETTEEAGRRFEKTLIEIAENAEKKLPPVKE